MANRLRRVAGLVTCLALNIDPATCLVGQTPATREQVGQTPTTRGQVSQPARGTAPRTSAEAVLRTSVPADLAGTASKVGEVTLRWTAAPGVTYDVLRSASPNGPFTQIATGLVPAAGATSMTFTSAKLYPTGTIYHQVAASNPAAAVSGESPVIATTLTPNAQPAALKAVYHYSNPTSNGTIEVSWEPVAGASGYMVTRSDGKAVNSNKLVRGTKVVDSEPASTRLTYAVTAYFPVAPEFGLPTIEQGEMPGPAGRAPQALVQLQGQIWRMSGPDIEARVSKVPGAKMTYLMRGASVSTSDWTVVASAPPDRGSLSYKNTTGEQSAYRLQAAFPDGSLAWGPAVLIGEQPQGPVLSAVSGPGQFTIRWAPLAGANGYWVSVERIPVMWFHPQPPNSTAQVSVILGGLPSGPAKIKVQAVGRFSGGETVTRPSEVTVTAQ